MTNDPQLTNHSSPRLLPTASESRPDVSQTFHSVPRPFRIAIVGGGISGLAAAWFLTRSSPAPEIVLLESSSRLGGVLETISDGPYIVERSADNFATLIPDALRFSEESGYLSELISPNTEGRQAYVLRRGRVLPIPAGFSLMQPTRIAPILTTRTLSLCGKLRLLSEYLVKARRDQADESLESFATRRLGREAFENLVEPIVSGIFTADPAKLSMQATLPQFLAMESQHGGLIRGYLALRRDDSAAAARRASGARYDQFLAPRKGMSHWIEHIQRQLPTAAVQLNTTVRHIQRVKSELVTNRQPDADTPREGWRLETSRDAIDCDGLIIATPNYQAANLLGAELPKLERLLTSVTYASSAVVALVIDRCDLPNRLTGFGLIVPRKERRPTLAISYSSNKYPGRAPEDQILLRMFFGGAMQEDFVERSDSDLETIAQDELRSILGWQGKRPWWQAVIRWKQAMPQYHVGHVGRMEELQQVLQSTPSLKLCGAGYAGVGIPQCIRSARRAIDELLQHFTMRDALHR